MIHSLYSHSWHFTHIARELNALTLCCTLYDTHFTTQHTLHPIHYIYIHIPTTLHTSYIYIIHFLMHTSRRTLHSFGRFGYITLNIAYTHTLDTLIYIYIHVTYDASTLHFDVAYTFWYTHFMLHTLRHTLHNATHFTHTSHTISYIYTHTLDTLIYIYIHVTFRCQNVVHTLPR